MAIYRFIFLCLGSFFSLSMAVSAKAETCTMIDEAIEKIYAPRLGTYSLWDIIDGSLDIKRTFNDFLHTGEKEVILAGFEENRTLRRPVITKINRKGRTLWTWMDKEMSGVSRPISVLKLQKQGDNFLAVGQIYQNKTPHALWFARFSGEGKKLSEHILSEPQKHITYGALIPALKGNGWFLGITEQRITQEPTLQKPNSRFLHLDAQFKVLVGRSFLPGPDNRVHDLIAQKNSDGSLSYLAVGEIITDSGQTNGLILKLDEEANIVWQRTYTRGGGLRFNKVSLYKNLSLLVLGEAQPLDSESPRAATLMSMDPANGTELWQRYYMRGDVSYKGHDMLTEQSGRINILLWGHKDKNDALQDHARIISISPRGEMIGDLSYTAGKAVLPLRLKNGLDDSIMLSGQVTLEEPDPSDPVNKTVTAYKGWLLVGEPLAAYKDPCMVTESVF